MDKRKILDAIVTLVAIVLFCALVAFSGILMRYGAFCESQLPSMQETNFDELNEND